MGLRFFSIAFSIVLIFTASIYALRGNIGSGKSICSPKQTRQILPYHYEPVPGKLLGVWPGQAQKDENSLWSFMYEWGFTGTAVYTENIANNFHYTRSLKIGFKPENIMILTWEDNYKYAVDNLPAGYYYLDEPVEHDCSGHASNGTVIYTPQQLADRTNYVHSIRPDSKFVIGGYKRCSHLRIAVEYSDLVMYSSYSNWNSAGLPVCHTNISFGNNWEAPWIPGDDNQSDSWRDMKGNYGNKFSMTWVRAGGDEYNDLFPAANSLGLSAIWLYGADGIDESKLSEFCNAAWINGWLIKVDDSFIAAPGLLNAGTARLNEVNLNWTDNSSNEKGFVIERKTDDQNDFTLLDTLPSNNISYKDTTVEQGRSYQYRICAFNNYTVSDYSPTVTITTLSLPGIPVLCSPLNNDKQVPVNLICIWKKTKGAEKYRFQLSADSLFDNFSLNDTIVNDTVNAINKLENSTRYFWRVRGENNNGQGAWSDIRSFSTLVSLPEIPLPVYPVNCASGQPLNTLLVWSIAANAEKYRLIFSKDSTFSGNIIYDTVLIKNIWKSDTLKQGTLYFWKVAARNIAGFSPFSQTSSFNTLLYAPDNLKAAASAKNIRLSWLNRAQNNTGVKIERKTTSDFLLLETLYSKANFYTDTAVVPGVNYIYRLRAFNDVVLSDYSNESEASVITSILSENPLPANFEVSQNHPNPFNSATRLKYALPQQSSIKIYIYNSLGKNVHEYATFAQAPGTYEFNINMSELSSGIYFLDFNARAITDGSMYRSVKKMIYLK